jgi:hypothetical protein
MLFITIGNKHLPISKKNLFFISFGILLLGILSYFSIFLPDQFSQEILTQCIHQNFLPSSYETIGHEKIPAITAQPLRYLGKGSQAIAFISADNQYVIKFFLNERFHTKLRIRHPFKKAYPPRIRYDVLNRYAKAFQEIREETGLIAVHLSATTSHLPSCYLQDPQGYYHLIDLNRFSFVVQKRCDCLNTTFSKMSKKEKKKTLAALQTLMQTLAKKGFHNLRNSFKEENFAMLGDQALMIDVGNVIFIETQKKHPEEELQRIKEQLETWVKEKS